jgi:hypothetical protein
MDFWSRRKGKNDFISLSLPASSLLQALSKTQEVACLKTFIHLQIV